MIQENPLIANSKEYGLTKQEVWRNNNSTQEQKLYIVDLKDLYNQPVKMITDLFHYKLNSKDENFVIVPVAGWKTKKSSVISQIFSTKGKEGRLLEEYAQSFSLSPITTAKNASVALRVSNKAQKMEIFDEGEESYLRVSAGVRITDGDQYLFKKGFAFPPNMPTLHVASLVGAAANGCYGPGRDYQSMTTNIIAMKVINASGKELVLSSKENSHLFEILRDCHLGTCFVSEMTLKIEPKFLMKRCHMLFKDVHELKQRMIKDNLIAKEHFIAMYIPVDMRSEGDHASRIRITNFERTDEKPTKKIKTQEQKNFSDYLNLELTEMGEPLINLITTYPKLREFFPFFLKMAAHKTFGEEKETSEIGWSGSIAHVLGTYTDLPICDINWLIQVENVEDARELLLNLMELSEKLLIENARNHEYPLLNVFSRYLKGIYYPEGKGGIAPTGVDKEHQGILSFEFVTYTPLAETPAFKSLVEEVVKYLDRNKRKYNYHPGKNMPGNIRSLKQIFRDAIGKQRLKNFKKAVYELHGGKQNIPYSPFLTPQKKEFIGFKNSEIEEVEELKLLFNKNDEELNIEIEEGGDTALTKSEKKVVKAILKLAIENEVHNKEVVEKIKEYLKK